MKNRLVPIRRSAPPPRKTRVKAVNRKRRDARWLHAFGSEARVRFVASLPCLAHSPICHGEIHNHHTKNGGMGKKAPASSVVPLCAVHHAAIHTMGRATFAFLYDLDLERESARVEAMWQSFSGSTDDR